MKKKISVKLLIVLQILLFLMTFIYGCLPNSNDEGVKPTTKKYKSIEEFINDYYNENPELEVDKEVVISNFKNFKKDTTPSKDEVNPYEITPLEDGSFKVVTFGDKPLSMVANINNEVTEQGIYITIKSSITIREADIDKFEMVDARKSINGDLNFETVCEISITPDGVLVTSANISDTIKYDNQAIHISWGDFFDELAQLPPNIFGDGFLRTPTYFIIDYSTEPPTITDPNGRVIGYVNEWGTVTDEDGNVIGYVTDDGKLVLTGSAGEDQPEGGTPLYPPPPAGFGYDAQGNLKPLAALTAADCPFILNNNSQDDEDLVGAVIWLHNILGWNGDQIHDYLVDHYVTINIDWVSLAWQTLIGLLATAGGASLGEYLGGIVGAVIGGLLGLAAFLWTVWDDLLEIFDIADKI